MRTMIVFGTSSPDSHRSRWCGIPRLKQKVNLEVLSTKRLYRTPYSQVKIMKYVSFRICCVPTWNCKPVKKHTPVAGALCAFCQRARRTGTPPVTDSVERLHTDQLRGGRPTLRLGNQSMLHHRYLRITMSIWLTQTHQVHGVCRSGNSTNSSSVMVP